MIPIFILSAGVIFGFAGLATDTSVMIENNRVDQNAADAAALAASYYVYANSGGDTTAATTYSNVIAAADGCSGTCSITYSWLLADGVTPAPTYAAIAEVKASVTDQRATYFSGVPGFPANVLLNPSAVSQVTSPSGAATIGCAICILGNSATALSSDGPITVTGNIKVNGGISSTQRLTATGGTCTAVSAVTPASTCATGAPSITDPLASTPIPVWTGLTTMGNVSEASNATIGPGIYDSLVLAGNNTVLTLTPGLYVFDGGGGFTNGNSWTIQSGAAAASNQIGTGTKDGVTLFFTCGGSGVPRACNPGEAGAGFSTTGNSTTLAMVAPSSGVLDNILFFFDRNSTASFALAGNSFAAIGDIGALYGPNTALTFSQGGGGVGIDPPSLPIIALSLSDTGGKGFSGSGVGSAGYHPPTGNLIK